MTDQTGACPCFSRQKRNPEKVIAAVPRAPEIGKMGGDRLLR
ncbi:hypothetical protein [Picosynechococcus sp. NKBG15041c]|nr:hypothetical protein [Picosynechococcus sp. NKBG15041c]